MPVRPLDWNGLVALAQQVRPEDRVITVAGLPARVKRSLATDAGFYVHSLAEDHADEKWSLKTREHMLLLRQLVDAGQVGVDEGDGNEALARAWGRLLAEDSGCYVAGCRAPKEYIAIEGPVWTSTGGMLKACYAHRESAVQVLALNDRTSAEQ